VFGFGGRGCPVRLVVVGELKLLGLPILDLKLKLEQQLGELAREKKKDTAERRPRRPRQIN
jgi:hypothetical protein